MESTRISCEVIDEQLESKRKQRVNSLGTSSFLFGETNTFYTDEYGSEFFCSQMRKRDLLLLILGGLAMFAGILIMGIGIGQAIK